MYSFNVVLGLLDELLELKEYVKHESLYNARRSEGHLANRLFSLFNNLETSEEQKFYCVSFKTFQRIIHAGDFMI